MGLGFCILSFGAGIVLGVFDKRAEIITKRKTGDGTHTHTHTRTHTHTHTHTHTLTHTHTHTRTHTHTHLYTLNKKIIVRNVRLFSGEKISIRDVKDFPLRLWMIFIVCVTYYVTVFPFIALAVIFLMEKYGYDAKEANLINSLVKLKMSSKSQCTYEHLF